MGPCHVLPLLIRMVLGAMVLKEYRTLVEGSHPSSEKHSVYSTALADWAKRGSVYGWRPISQINSQSVYRYLKLGPRSLNLSYKLQAFLFLLSKLRHKAISDDGYLCHSQLFLVPWLSSTRRFYNTRVMLISPRFFALVSLVQGYLKLSCYFS